MRAARPGSGQPLLTEEVPELLSHQAPHRRHNNIGLLLRVFSIVCVQGLGSYLQQSSLWTNEEPARHYSNPRRFLGRLECCHCCQSRYWFVCYRASNLSLLASVEVAMLTLLSVDLSVDPAQQRLVLIPVARYASRRHCAVQLA